MMQLDLTAYGDTAEEVLYHLLKLVRQMQSGQPAGRTHAVRPDRLGRGVLTTMAKYTVREKPHVAAPLAMGVAGSRAAGRGSGFGAVGGCPRLPAPARAAHSF